MPCTSPIAAYQHTVTRTVTFKETADTRPLTLSCGQCIGCKLMKSQEWAIRCVHESQMHLANSFLTLTYNDDNLLDNGSLHKPHLQKFFKRLRKFLDIPLRYYACGEYGDTTKRAHYHVCLFGADFTEDRILWESHEGINQYVSPTLEKIWGMGHARIGELNFQTAAYCARYTMKKRFGGMGGKAVSIDEATGELTELQQPFAIMSLRPAIGRSWIEKYHGDIYNIRKDYVYLNGNKYRPPKYYDTIYETINGARLDEIKLKRYQDNEGKTTEELQTHARIMHARTKSKDKI